jgi:hypothetical protein
MATIEQYQSGEAAKAVKTAIEAMQTQDQAAGRVRPG